VEQLHQHIATRVDAWRAAEYPCPDHPAIGEILECAGDAGEGDPRFLRNPQMRALETYWWLRLVKGTPHVFELYRRIYPPESNLAGLLEALGVPDGAFKAMGYREDVLWDRIAGDDDFVRDFKLEALRETLSLSYPSYILALAMGAGKTVLIGAVIATEFAMAQEYPEGPFVQNALVFAPGKTILESLRELLDVPYERILPPRLHKGFAASVKFTFTRDGEKNVPVIRGSSFNVLVTNTEKIRIQKESIRKSDLGALFAPTREDEARAEIANLRLQTIASLPHLAVFSDEAHHTYGQSLDSELKKVRKTVNYLAANTNVLCVVNTTGTPYFKRQPLKDVVIWYGLSAGIRENILKDVAGNIQAYDFSEDARAYVAHVIEDFFRDYGNVRLPNGAAAKLALYFPQTDDLKELKPVVDEALARVGLSPAVCLVNTSDETITKQADIDDFNRLNDPASPHRVILLVNKGTEGWNCPSLFACALARRLRTSNNFVLQAATRCLRQVPGNTHKARIYLSRDNFGILDRQLQETYGETIQELNRAGQESRHERIVLRKIDMPPILVTQTIRTVIRKEGGDKPLRLERPADSVVSELRKAVFTVGEQAATSSVLRQLGDTVTIEAAPEALDVYAAAVELAGRYRLDVLALYDELRRVYGAEDVPPVHLDALSRQIEDQTRSYETIEERVDRALALVRIDPGTGKPDPRGWRSERGTNGEERYFAEIVYPKEREGLLLRLSDMKHMQTPGFGFHYDPYNFDSNPEKSFFDQILQALDEDPDDVEDVYFTGALTNPSQTEFFVEYKDEKGKWRRYTPDFVIRKKPPEGAAPGSGRVLIVEVKRERDRAHPVDGEGGRKAAAVRKWEGLDPERLRYEMIFTGTESVARDGMEPALRFVRKE